MSSRAKNLQDLFATSAVVQRMMHSYIHRTFDELGVAPSQLQLLHLIEHQQPISLKHLANDMRLTPGAITQLIEGLVKAGYVERTASNEDRRITVVTLTTAGNDKIGAISRLKRKLLTQVAADLDDNELEIYLRVQQKMLAYLETNCRNIKK